MAGTFVAALVQAHSLDDGQLASRSGNLRAGLHNLDPHQLLHGSTAPRWRTGPRRDIGERVPCGDRG
jgi:hypothetical protein